MNPASANASALLPDELEGQPDAASPTVSGGGGVPVHLGIIMDGNGRWAERQGLPRVEGHRKGVEALRKAIRAIGERGIAHVTLFAFSSENWKRPEAEVRDLMLLLRLFIKRDLKELRDNGVKVCIIGQRDNLAPDLLDLLNEAETVTKDGTQMRLNIAFNYGGRDEIVRAARDLAQQVAQGSLEASAITEQHISSALDTAGVPDPDLIIRTSGEMRLSNFLLWQIAYAEFVFTETLWPDFDALALDQALDIYRTRNRRFGGR